MEFPIAPFIKRTKLHPSVSIASDVQPQVVGSASLLLKFVMEQQLIVMMVQMNQLKLILPAGFIVHKVAARYYYWAVLQYIEEEGFIGSTLFVEFLHSKLLC